MKNKELQELIEKKLPPECSKTIVVLIDELEIKNDQLDRRIKDYEKLAQRDRKTINHSREKLKDEQEKVIQLNQQLIDIKVQAQK